MDLIADILLISGALGAGLYCIVLSRRLNRFTNLERGVGGAIAVLSAQVDDMTKALEEARTATSTSATSLKTITSRAEGIAQRLELLVASMHDLPKDFSVKDETNENDDEAGQDQSIFQSRRTAQKVAA